MHFCGGGIHFDGVTSSLTCSKIRSTRFLVFTFRKDLSEWYCRLNLINLINVHRGKLTYIRIIAKCGYEYLFSGRNFAENNNNNNNKRVKVVRSGNWEKDGQVQAAGAVIHFHGLPVAVDTLWPINNAGLEFLSDLGKNISQVSNDHCESAFLFQRLSVLIQRFNAVAIQGTFAHTPIEDDIQTFQLFLVFNLCFSIIQSIYWNTRNKRACISMNSIAMVTRLWTNNNYTTAGTKINKWIMKLTIMYTLLFCYKL